eukprot:COSAG02_NODE_9701_length_2137_cov_5.145731_1_plen_52_part_00
MIQHINMCARDDARARGALVGTDVRYVQLPTPCVLVGSTSLVSERGANTHS